MKNRNLKRTGRANAQPVNLLIFSLTFHIFSVHAKLLYYLNPELEEKVAFSFLKLNEPTVTVMLFALAYSLGTFTVLRKSRKRWLIWIYAALDSVGVLLYYFTKIPLYFGAIYFALYTGTLILSSMYLNSPEHLSDQILEMKGKGMTQREIAEQLDLSDSKVSRLLSQVKIRSSGLTRTKGNVG